MILIPTPSRIKAHVAKAQQWRDRRTHRFVTWLWARFNPDTCEPVERAEPKEWR